MKECNRLAMGIAFCLLALCTQFPQLAYAGDSSETVWNNHAKVIGKDIIGLEASRASGTRQGGVGPVKSVGPVKPVKRGGPVAVWRPPVWVQPPGLRCNTGGLVDDGACARQVARTLGSLCPRGFAPMRDKDSVTGTTWTCTPIPTRSNGIKPKPQPGPAVAEQIRQEIEREAKTIRLGSGTFRMQPDRGVLVNMPTYLYSVASTQSFNVSLLGVDVQVEATPVSFKYQLGDGQTLQTSSLGGPYPGGDVTYTYKKGICETQIVATTFWQARFLDPATGEWVPLDHQLETVDYSVPFRVEERTSIIITDQLAADIAQGRAKIPNLSTCPPLTP